MPKNTRVPDAKKINAEYFTYKSENVFYGSKEFYDCEMVEDFGELKKGEKYDCIIFDYERSVCSVFNDGESVVHVFRIKLVAVR